MNPFPEKRSKQTVTLSLLVIIEYTLHCWVSLRNTGYVLQVERCLGSLDRGLTVEVIVD